MNPFRRLPVKIISLISPRPISVLLFVLRLGVRRPLLVVTRGQNDRSRKMQADTKMQRQIREPPVQPVAFLQMVPTLFQRRQKVRVMVH